MIFKVTLNKIKKWGKEKNLEKLVEAMGCQDAELRKAAILSMASIGDRAAMEHIQFHSKYDTDFFVREEASKVLLVLEKSYYDSRNEVIIEYQQPAYQIIPSGQGA